MRHRELRRLFIGLAAIAAPVPFAVVGCGGTVENGSIGEPGAASGGTGGEVPPVYGGKVAPPVCMGLCVSAGGAPSFMGFSVGGAPVYMGTGPVYVGTGGAPVYTGTGGGPAYVGGDASPPLSVDAGIPIVPDAGFCTDPRGPTPFCLPVYCVPADVAPDSGVLDCRSACGGDAGLFATSCSLFAWDGRNYAKCFPDCTGRKPPGLLGTPFSFDNDLRFYFEQMSRLEAASVPAFRILGRELRMHGAPRSLLRAARRAARDEVRHTRMGKILAERFGGRYVRPEIAPRPPRSIEAIALDNAVEGCVRETFGAMIATWQSRAASDPVVRRIMRAVAVDETRHAALALRVAKWAEHRLDAAANRRVRDARRAAAETVYQELAYEPSAALASIAGVPRSVEARRLAAALTEKLWA